MRWMRLLVVLPGLFWPAACSHKATFNPENELVVVQGFLYSGEAINDIRVTSTLGLGSLDTIAPPIEDAEVRLIKNGFCYLLEPLWWKPGYYRYGGDCPEGDCPGGGLKVEPGDRFNLEVSYFSKVAIAETVVPSPPAGVSVAPNPLPVSSAAYTGARDSINGGPFIDDSTAAVTVSWADDGNSMYYVTLEYRELIPRPISPDNPFPRPGTFVSRPFSGDHFVIGWSNISHYGLHRVKVCRLNREYAELYLSRVQDTRDLNEPVTNIRNGLGIFTAFGSTYTEFRVEPQ
jgi:hypothetical protein